MDKNIEQLINDIVWWIPFKNKRNNLRDQLINSINLHCNKSEIDIEMLSDYVTKTAELLTFYDDVELKKHIFKKNVEHVEVGIFSYCNRKCWFCSNSIIDESKKNIFMDENIFLKILNELSSINYSNNISLHRYNEPLYNKEVLLKRLRQVREYLPNAHIGINTNGDYLNIEYLKELNEIGVNQLIIAYYYDYNDKNTPFDIDNIIAPEMDKFINKLQLKPIEIIKNDITYRIILKYGNINIIYKANNMNVLATDRGGTIKTLSNNHRYRQCSLLNVQSVIDYDGSYVICCHVRSDIPEHQKYIIGNIKDNSIFELFTNNKIINFRKELLRNELKHGACKHCIDYRTWFNFT